jgi:hypothetical protein
MLKSILILSDQISTLEKKEKGFVEEGRQLKQQINGEIAKENEIKQAVAQLRSFEVQLPEKVTAARNVKNSIEQELLRHKTGTSFFAM